MASQLLQQLLRIEARDPPIQLAAAVVLAVVSAAAAVFPALSASRISR